MKKVSEIINYIGWLIKKHNELQQQNPAFKLIKVTKNKINEDILHIQITNKAVILYCKPMEIIPYDNLLEGFSKKDIRTITYLATKNECEPDTQIISQRFCEQIKRFFLKMKRRDSENHQELSANEISQNKKLLCSLSQQDAYKIGFLSAMEQFDLELDFIKSKEQRDE